jgi:hypothetical protein
MALRLLTKLERAFEKKSRRHRPMEAIRRFHVNMPEKRLKDLRRRIAATQWPDQELVSDPSQGVLLTTIKKLADYWERIMTGLNFLLAHLEHSSLRSQSIEYALFGGGLES